MTYSLNDYIDAAAVLMAGRDKEIERLKAQVFSLELRWETAVNLYPDLEYLMARSVWRRCPACWEIQQGPWCMRCADVETGATMKDGAIGG